MEHTSYHAAGGQKRRIIGVPPARPSAGGRLNREFDQAQRHTLPILLIAMYLLTRLIREFARMSSAISHANAATATPVRTYAFDAIPAPGAYVCNWSGHLLRMPREALTNVKVAALNIVGNTPLTVTKLSDDPFIPLNRAKRLAGDLRIPVTF